MKMTEELEDRLKKKAQTAIASEITSIMNEIETVLEQHSSLLAANEIALIKRGVQKNLDEMASTKMQQKAEEALLSLKTDLAQVTQLQTALSEKEATIRTLSEEKNALQENFTRTKRELDDLKVASNVAKK